LDFNRISHPIFQMSPSHVPEDILINFTPQETRVAVMYQGAVQELHIERNASRGLVGNIYVGSRRAHPARHAIGVHRCRPERTAFLHVADIWEPRR
jgi:ribonuclease G